MNFSGEVFNTIDAKWRVSIPKEFRDILAEAGEEGLVVTRNRDSGLTAYPPSEWKVFAERLQSHGSAPQKTALNRLYIAPRSEVRFDAQGRIPLTRSLRSWAGISEDERDLVVVGNFRRIDIFTQSRYAEVVGQAVDLLQENEEIIEELELP